MTSVKVQRRIKREADLQGQPGSRMAAISAMGDDDRKRKMLNAKKQERARLRRAQRRAVGTAGRDPEDEVKVAKKMGWSKPLSEWDADELAHGYPRNSEGRFSRVRPTVIPRAVHEEAISRFRDLATQDLRVLVPDAIKLVHGLILNEELDERGRMVVPPSVKLQAAQWVVEHLVGKPRQPVDVDISVKLQGILANVMVSPDELAQRRASVIPAIGRDLVGDEEATR